MRQTRESRPADNQAAKTFSGGTNTSISAEADRTTASVLVTGVHVVVVETPAGKYRRRVYFNLPGAQRAADRAIMAGHSAHVILCQLIPVTGGEW
jgi:hypothetical protein